MAEPRDVQRIAGSPFSDTLDGYFPLATSISQMMRRNGFEQVLFGFSHAPFLDTPKIADSDPVPFSLGRHRSGLFGRMVLAASTVTGRLHLYGKGSWVRDEAEGQDTHLSGRIRMGEPVIIAGFGVSVGGTEIEADTHVALVRLATPSVPSDTLRSRARQLGWDSAEALFLEPWKTVVQLAPEEALSPAIGAEHGPACAALTGGWSHLLTQTA